MITSSKEEAPIYFTAPCKQFNTGEASYSAYGISCRSGGTVTTVEDVACNGDIAGKMAELFTLCQLPPPRLVAAIIALLP